MDKYCSRKKAERAYLANHQAVWTQAKDGQLPSASTFEAYSRDAEQGIASIRTTQKDIRASLRTAPDDFHIHRSSGQTITVDVKDPETYWKVEGLLAWHQAIEMKSPASRDYADWLQPYLRPHSFADPSYDSFWLNEVLANNMPLNRITGLVSYYQLQQKITHGNAADQIHASCWLTHDLFITADRGFYDALTSAAHHYPRRTLPILVNREESSFVAQLEGHLNTGRS